MKRDPQENAQALYQIADTQGGYFTAAQARQAGYAYSQQHFHVERGNWQRVDRGLFRLRDYPPGEREALIRWSLRSRNQKGVPQAVVSRDTALTVHELSDVMPARVHLTVPPGFRKRIPPEGYSGSSGCVLHKDRLAPGDVEARPASHLRDEGQPSAAVPTAGAAAGLGRALRRPGPGSRFARRDLVRGIRLPGQLLVNVGTVHCACVGYRKGRRMRESGAS